MNKIGGKSNSGEGGENPKRYEIQEDGTVLFVPGNCPPSPGLAP
jgi:glutamate synthase domain-containing protein 2